MTTDKNGVDLNIGDEVIYDHSIGLWKIKSVSKNNNVIYCRSEIYETCLSTKEVTKFIPAPVERTYTEAEIRKAYDAGIEFQNDMHFDIGRYKIYNSEYDSFYRQFLEELNTPEL